MRFRLRTLLIAVIIGAIIANAIASERNASQKVIELDDAVLTTLKSISPEVIERFDIDWMIDPDDDLSCYDFFSVRHSANSLFIGPRWVRRVVCVDDYAEVAINIEAPWYYVYCGNPKISIDFTPSRGNQWLAKKLAAELVANGVLDRDLK